MTAPVAGRGAGCAHCGLPLPGTTCDPSSAPAGEAFCCTGCYVAHSLSGAGLDQHADRLLSRVVLCAFLAMGVMVFSLSLYGALLDPGGEEGGAAADALKGVFRMGALALALPVFLLLGVPLAQAVFSLGRWLSAETLVLAGAGAALLVSIWHTLRGGGEVYFDTATMVLLLYSVGRWLDVRARERARAELSGLADEREPAAHVVDAAGEREVRPDDVARGDLVRVRPGEQVLVDGLVVEGRSFADTSALSGEEEPASFGPGDRVLAGTRLVDGSLVVRAEAVGAERLRDGIERLLGEALRGRAASVRLADRLAGALLPVVLALAVATAVWHWRAGGAEAGLLAALSVVLISCPCALGIATPLAFWTAMGTAWRRGVLVRGGEVLERLARARRVLFDKTGTLTVPEPELDRLEPAAGLDEGQLLALAAALEAGSEHPLGRSVRRAFAERLAGRAAPAVEGFRALPGVGVEGRVDGSRYTLRRADDAGQHAEAGETRVVLERGDGRALGVLVFRARLAPGAAEAVAGLRARRFELAVLTGDAVGPARALGEELGVEVEAGCSPLDKLERVRAAGAGTVFVGDGLNDAAALAAADVGVSVAGGSARSLDAAQVNLLRPGLGALVETLDLARSAVRTARFNLAWAFGYNAVGLWLAASGRLSPIFAASAMVASSVVVVLNSGRLRQGAASTSARPATDVR